MRLSSGRAVIEALASRRRGRDAVTVGQSAKLVIAYVLRRGGAIAQPLFDDEGRLLATEPLWGPTARGLAEFHLTTACRLRLREALATLDGSAEPWTAEPSTLGDLLFFQALAEFVSEVATADEAELAGLLQRGSPLAALSLVPGVEPDWPRLMPALTAGWVVPYLGDHWVRAWLDADQRRGRLQRAEEARLNERLASLLEGLMAIWQNQRTEHLRVLVRYLYRRLRLADGPAGIMRVTRRGDWSEWTTRDREAFEASLGRVFALAGRLAGLAEELRGLGWQRTEADEALLGSIGRDLGPHEAGLRQLHHELCRLV